MEWLIATGVVAAFTLGCILGYSLQCCRKVPVTDEESTINRLCGVIERQSDSIRSSQRQSLDAAVMPVDLQLERQANERLADVTISGAKLHSPKSKNLIGGEFDDVLGDGFQEETLSTEMP